METKGKRLRVLQCNLQIAVYQLFTRNQSCGFYNSEIPKSLIASRISVARPGGS